MRTGQAIPPGRDRWQHETVRRAPHTSAATIEDVSVDHGRAHVPMAEELLNGADVIAAFEQVCGERVTIMPRAA